ncbi:uncharacterized protein [Apostichopus japonicus]|uniref:uncharacterized protein isoform X2 n=1 Tax=Stichopus japonicus TaxID=307972 RepID=UPI003AB65E54
MSVRLGQCCSRLLYVQLEESWQKSEIRFARKIHAARCWVLTICTCVASVNSIDCNCSTVYYGLLVIAKLPGVSVNAGRTDAVSVTQVVPQLAEACNLPFLEIVKAPENNQEMKTRSHKVLSMKILLHQRMRKNLQTMMSEITL